MCGITGLLGPKVRAGAHCLEPMTRALRHRGPDDSGLWCRDFAVEREPFQVALGHARLAILDLSAAGHQPMSDPSGCLTIAFNGEIYNFRELRRELAQRGHPFQTECDTEVLLAAWKEWGAEALQRLHGMFALALWDAQRQQLTLGRDRLGIKPLYYQFADGLLLFASELGALRQHEAFRPEIDRQALADYMRTGYVIGPRSIYAQVSRVMPGQLLCWRRGELQRRQWWEPLSPAPSRPPRSFEEAVDGLEERLAAAVEERLVSDRPLGAFLSGGIDSSSIVSLMQAAAPGRVRTFSIGFEKGRSEAAHARAVAAHLGTDHTEFTVRSQEARKVALELPVLYDEPFADHSVIPTTLLSRLTRQHVTVALSGDGGDELFGGYWQYRKLQRLLPLLRLPVFMRRPLAKLAGRLPTGSLRNGLQHLEASGPAELAWRLIDGCGDAALARLLGGHALPDPLFITRYRSAPSRDPIQRAMLADSGIYLPDDILTKVDRASMSVALEVRVPLLDHRVVDFALSLPMHLVWHGGETKAPLRALLDRRVPRKLVDRPKQGFGLPLEELLQDSIRRWSEQLLTPERLREDGFFRPEAVAHLLGRARRRSGTKGEALMRWRLIAFQRWYGHTHRGEELA